MDRLIEYINGSSLAPLFLQGDAIETLRSLPDASIDCVVTSPPYWNKRQYESGGIGLESNYQDYVDYLVECFTELYRVIKPTGSFWLNIGDTYANKSLLNIPWRVSISLTEKGWILRNTIIWNKVKGGLDNTSDRLGNVYEPVFHFVKSNKGYYYDVDSIRNTPKSTKVVNGAVVSATGVTGVRYKRKIELSTELTEEQKECAFKALDEMLAKVQNGEISDFRMVIKGQQRKRILILKKYQVAQKSFMKRDSIFLNITRKAVSQQIYGILSRKIRRDGKHISRRTLKTCAGLQSY